MDAVERTCLQLLRAHDLSPPAIPVVCCAKAETLETIEGVDLWHSMRRTIEFHKTIVSLERRRPHRYIDVGPTGTLATFVKHSLSPASASRAYCVMTRYGHDSANLQALLVMVNDSLEKPTAMTRCEPRVFGS